MARFLCLSGASSVFEKRSERATSDILGDTGKWNEEGMYWIVSVILLSSLCTYFQFVHIYTL